MGDLISGLLIALVVFLGFLWMRPVGPKKREPRRNSDTGDVEDNFGGDDGGGDGGGGGGGD